MAYRMVITEEGARKAARRWFRRGAKSFHLRREARIVELYPVYLPFWRFLVRGLGMVLGYNVTYVKDSNGNLRRSETPEEKTVIKDYDWTLIACDAGDIGIRRLRNLEGEVIESSDEFPTYEPTTSKDAAMDATVREITEMILREAGVQNITEKWTYVIPRNASLLYYPIWIVRYTFREKMYFLTVDGVTGEVLSGRAPGEPLFRALALSGGAALGGALSSLVVLGKEVGVMMFFMGLALFLMSYRFFRHGSEIVEGDFPRPASPGKKLFMSMMLGGGR